MSDFNETMRREVINCCRILMRRENCSAMIIPEPNTDRIACFGTRADILDLLRDDQQWVEYKGVD